MSYILEALRRSQAERERGRVPGLDAQPMPAAADGSARPGLPVTWVGVAAAAALVVVCALLISWGVQRPDRPATVAVEAPAAGTRVAPETVSPPTPTAPSFPTPRSMQPNLPQVVSAPPVPLPAVQPPATAMRDAPSPALPVPTAPATAPRTQPQSQSQSQVAAPVPTRALALAELNADQRRELPAMVVGGSIWSDNAANRFVVVNGQVVREGEPAAPGATLERIGPSSVIVRWRDLRIEVPL